jgi:hypothetical protein
VSYLPKNTSPMQLGTEKFWPVSFLSNPVTSDISLSQGWLVSAFCRLIADCKICQLVGPFLLITYRFLFYVIKYLIDNNLHKSWRIMPRKYCILCYVQYLFCWSEIHRVFLMKAPVLGSGEEFGGEESDCEKVRLMATPPPRRPSVAHSHAISFLYIE